MEITNDIIAFIRANRKKLEKGSVIDPFNHPSYTVEQANNAKERHDKAAALIAKAEALVSEAEALID